MCRKMAVTWKTSEEHGLCSRSCRAGERTTLKQVVSTADNEWRVSGRGGGGGVEAQGLAVATQRKHGVDTRLDSLRDWEQNAPVIWRVTLHKNQHPQPCASESRLVGKDKTRHALAVPRELARGSDIKRRTSSAWYLSLW